MWAIMRATSIASCSRIACRATLRERDVLGGQPRGRAHQHARARSRPGGRAPTAGSACRRASRRSRRAAASMPSARSSARCTSARSRTVNSGKSSPYGSPVAGLIDDGPVVPLQPPSRFEQIDVEALGVDRACPGPIERVPPDRGLGVAGQRVADVDDRVAPGRRSARTRSRAARCRAPDSSVRPSGRTSVSTTRAPRGDDAGVEPRQVQPAVEARVLDLHAAVGDDVEPAPRPRSPPPRRCAARAASRTRRRPPRPPRARPPAAGRRAGTRRRCRARPGSSASDG